ncbi:exodeoxyribonuclease I [Pseudomonas fluorescens]|uniref:exodeoxyribonuclease I n=1 Tax=Pseudomonas fluorescens group TaxID=136843 RepID=UPI00178177BD|nr:exodeoxyribonuclease I [Pseudomonas fluorescens]MBD8177162.1 exodeoxyribonuclease I [Pseudomonas fluorescens]MBD8746803.1 exodeoxyribonuclease I [Pseudomonas fluorescens]MBD8751229.1 exodeoxyribonuclease I [Pseudomonas fluorescens]MBD8759901.1 exodeoxyribonuclease I [Pseudomonas fluorescens]
MTSIFWYDYETTGINPRSDRPLQVAGIRTDLELNEVGPPINLYCQPGDDILPHPAACAITGITPQVLAQKGLAEADFMTRVHAELSAPGTCGAGYNTLRFDDEMTRYSLYRNFFDPYAREWQGGNSRWDLIDVMRTAYALRPEGIVWPEQDGRVTLKLERLTQANGIDHGQAHDALSDVRATIALARLVRDKQPKLYEWLFQLRSKQRVMDQVRLLQPLVHISGRFSAERHYLGVVLPLAWHPRNRNALIVCDLGLDPQALLELDAQTLRERLYTRRDELAAGDLPVPLKLLHINRCPVVAPLKVLRAQDRERLQLDMEVYQARALRLTDAQELWRDKLAKVYAEEEYAPNADPEQQLYEGFIGDRDRRLCEQVRMAEPVQLGRQQWPFDDHRLPELLFRYRARNFPETLNNEEQERWRLFCQQRLSDPAWGAPNTLAAFKQAHKELENSATSFQCQVLGEWQDYADSLAARLNL